jgi:amino acid transporter
MGSTISREGGEVAFVFPTLGLKGSFIVGWMYILAWLVATCSFYVVAFGFLLSWLILQLNTIPIYEVAGWPIYLPVLLVGIAGNIVAFILNYIGAKIAARAQFVMFIFLMIFGAIIAVTALIKGSISNFFPPFPEGANPLLNSVRFALLSITYITGAELLATVAEETKVKPTTFGYLIASSAVIAGSFYILMMFSGSIIMPWGETVKVAPRGTMTYSQ